MNYDQILDFVLGREGGVSNNKADHGGLTKWGVTERTYRDYLAEYGRPQKSVVDMSEEEMRDIYMEDYWTPAKCYQLPSDVALVHFDCAVNSGVGRAAKLLQRACGVIEDGKIGPRTLEAARKPGVAAEYLHVRESFYWDIVRNDPSQKVFLQGWLNRLGHIKAALKL